MCWLARDWPASVSVVADAYSHFAEDGTDYSGFWEIAVKDRCTILVHRTYMDAKRYVEVVGAFVWAKLDGCHSTWAMPRCRARLTEAALRAAPMGVIRETLDRGPSRRSRETASRLVGGSQLRY